MRKHGRARAFYHLREWTQGYLDGSLGLNPQRDAGLTRSPSYRDGWREGHAALALQGREWVAFEREGVHEEAVA